MAHRTPGGPGGTGGTGGTGQGRAPIRPVLAVLGVAAIVVAVAIGAVITLAGGRHGGQAPSPSGGKPIAAATSSGPASRSSSGSAASSSAAASSPATAVYQASAEPLPAAIRARMTGVSWHAGCPLGLSSLRLLRLSYWGFDQRAHTGELIVNASVVSAVSRAFQLIFDAKYPIRQMRVVDDFGGSDERSMEADNTSGFNCRVVPGSTSWSEHAYGLAIDINPFENPMLTSGQADPPAAAAWADRSRTSPAIIRHGDAVWQAFKSVGWHWGGDWSNPVDYQHFSENGN